MKNLLTVLFAVVLLITGCNKSTYVDGTYHATFDTLDSHGWNAFVQFTLTEDVISAVDFDYYNVDDLRKSEDTAYQTRMSGIVGIGPVEYIPQIEAAITSATIVPQFDSIDAITGATHSSHNATELVKAALEAALEGTPTEIILPQVD